MMHNTVFVGGGPGGLSPLISALQSGRFDALAALGVVIVERGERVGAGTIGRYAINSDSAAETFISCIDGDSHARLVALRDHPLVSEIRGMRGSAIPLRMVGGLMDLIGEAIAGLIRDAGGEVLTGHEALSVQQRADGTWSVRVRGAEGPVREIHARSVVLATGGHQPPARLTTEPVAGEPLSPRYDATLMQSGDVLTHEGLARVADTLEGVAEPRIVVVGGSTSAVSAAHALLYRLPRSHLGDGAITILHRRELRVYYVTPAEAEADGYLEFGPDDICPVSNRVFRFAGLRFDSRELVMRARGIGGRPPEPR
ncbi:MAG: FAD-dependent oxidoreductase, partial [Janthinobacterium lividum]